MGRRTFVSNVFVGIEGRVAHFSWSLTMFEGCACRSWNGFLVPGLLFPDMGDAKDAA